jgi:phenylacetate-CoA ligase
MIKYKGTTLYPPTIFDVLDNVNYIENYIIELSNNDCGTDNILVKVGLREYSDINVVKDLKDRFRARIRVAPEIEICTAAQINEKSMPEGSRKPIRIIDNR